jgi:hypothetical protein
MEDFTGIKDLLTHLAWGGDLKASRPWSPDFGGGLIGAHLPDGLRKTGTHAYSEWPGDQSGEERPRPGQSLEQDGPFCIDPHRAQTGAEKSATAARSPITRG